MLGCSQCVLVFIGPAGPGCARVRVVPTSPSTGEWETEGMAITLQFKNLDTHL